MKTSLSNLFVLFLATSSQVAVAVDLQNTTPEKSNWLSVAHFGYGFEDRSNTGFEKAAGSLAFLDVLTHLTPNTEIGLRTFGSGGQASNGDQFFRLATGPMIGYEFWPAWQLQLAFSYFSESAEGNNEASFYRSRGLSTTVGWERLTQLSEGLELAWGGFWSYHSGDLTTIAAQNIKDLNLPARNIGTSRGLEIALRMPL